jgi:hypothetical protein
MEQWKDSFVPQYKVSNLGRVIGPKGRILCNRINTNGYLRINAITENGTKDIYIHRLVCVAFNGDPPFADAQVDHINKNRADNRSKNLRWVTASENRRHRKFPSGENHVHAKLSQVQVNEIKSTAWSRGSDGRLAAKFGVSREQVRDIRLNKCWRDQ